MNWSARLAPQTLLYSIAPYETVGDDIVTACGILATSGQKTAYADGRIHSNPHCSTGRTQASQALDVTFVLVKLPPNDVNL